MNVKLPPFRKIVTDRPTGRPTDRPRKIRAHFLYLCWHTYKLFLCTKVYNRRFILNSCPIMYIAWMNISVSCIWCGKRNWCSPQCTLDVWRAILMKVYDVPTSSLKGLSLERAQSLPGNTLDTWYLYEWSLYSHRPIHQYIIKDLVKAFDNSKSKKYIYCNLLFISYNNIVLLERKTYASLLEIHLLRICFV